MAGQLKTLEHQVAGHPGSVLTSEDGSYIVKPSLPLECQFYEVTAPRHFPELAAKAWIPAYHGQQEHTAPPKEGKVKIEQVRYSLVMRASSLCCVAAWPNGLGGPLQAQAAKIGGARTGHVCMAWTNWLTPTLRSLLRALRTGYQAREPHAWLRQAQRH
jgi:hypothetical protein